MRNKKKVAVVTGGAGFIGSHMVDLLLKKNFYVNVIDDLSGGSINNLKNHFKNKNFNFEKKDLCKLNVKHKFFFGCDYVFHFAAVVGVKRTLENPLLVLEDIKGFENVLNLCKSTGVSKIYFSSSSEVYGEPFEIPQNEHTTPLNSKLPYAIVKNLGESYLKSYQQEFGLKYSIFRFFNTYGPNQSEDFVVPKFINLALNNRDILIYGAGLQTRTFCYIDDNIDTILKIHNNSLYENDVINIGSDIEMTVLNLAKTIIKITNSKSKIIHLPALKEGDMLRRCPDITKMKSILNRELITLEVGVKKLINYYENRD